MKKINNCSKCGNENIYTNYRKKGDYLDECIGGSKKGEAEKECLYKHCRNCDYWWVEDTLDYKQLKDK